MKLNKLQSMCRITAFGFEAIKEYAKLSNQEGQKVNVATLAPPYMYDMGVNTYYAPVLPRGAVFNTSDDVFNADLDVQRVSVLLFPEWCLENNDKVVIVSRHKGTIDNLKNMYPDAPVLDGNVTEKDLKGLHIIGTLPPALIQFCKSYRAVTIKDFDYSKDGDLSGRELLDRIVICDPITVDVEEVLCDCAL